MGKFSFFVISYLKINQPTTLFLPIADKPIAKACYSPNGALKSKLN